MKVGQWVRHENSLYRLNGFCDCVWCKERGYEEPILKGVDFEYITSDKAWKEFLSKSKVADTPQELIQVGDMIALKHSQALQYVIYITEEGLIETNIPSGYFITHEDIQEIWTRTSDNTYTRQWRKEQWVKSYN